MLCGSKRDFEDEELSTKNLKQKNEKLISFVGKKIKKVSINKNKYKNKNKKIKIKT